MERRILVPREASRDVVASLDAWPVLDTLQAVDRANIGSPIGRLIALARRFRWFDRAWRFIEARDPRTLSTPRRLEIWRAIWAALDDQAPEARDIVYFTCANPLLIAGIGRWLSSRPAERRPWVFFRIAGGELGDTDAPISRDSAAFFRRACLEVSQYDGQERLFVLTCSNVLAQAGSRVAGRRIFSTPLATYFLPSGNGEAVASGQIVYIHTNVRTGQFIYNLGDLIHRVKAVAPDVRFVLKYRSNDPPLSAVRASLIGLAKVLPFEQGPADYVENFRNCSVVLLAYSSDYAMASSGVFVDATGYGKPVVVPRGTWMSCAMAAGRGVGVTYDELSVEAVAEALLQVLSRIDVIGDDARALSETVRRENSGLRYIERLREITTSRAGSK